MMISMRRGCLVSVLVVTTLSALVVPRADAHDFSDLKPSIANILKERRVPGASVAVLVGERIVWAEGIGVTEVDSDQPVTTATLFQAASISKPVTAFGALRLVDQGKLELDVPIKQYLKTAETLEPAQVVTLRQLLSHTAGLSVHGFGGYRSDAPLPTLSQILTGTPPANSDPVTIQHPPGTRSQYSGGGYCFAQQVMIDVTGEPFPDAMDALVLAPLSMESSTFQQPLPESLGLSAATAHDAGGQPTFGKRHTYPEQAAAGLWTTPTDLARFVLAVQHAHAGHAGANLSREMAMQMVKPQVKDGPGLGLFVSVDGDTTEFSHGGSNRGFRCSMRGTVRLGHGIAIMTNSERGGKVLRSIQQLIENRLAQAE